MSGMLGIGLLTSFCAGVISFCRRVCCRWFRVTSHMWRATDELLQPVARHIPNPCKDRVSACGEQRD